jgi:hypothetical protein
MAKVSKENREETKRIIQARNDITKKIAALDKSIKNKTEKDLKALIKMCKDFEYYTNFLKNLGYKVEIWHKRLDYKTWEAELENKTSVKSIKKTANKKPIKKSIIETPEVKSENSLYYIMLCWTNKNDYFVCGSVIDKIKTYFEKLKLEFFDTQTTTFPDRTEHCSTFKFRGSEDTYNTIISSAEYIIDISASTVIEHCNVGVFGKRIE